MGTAATIAIRPSSRHRSRDSASQRNPAAATRSAAAGAIRTAPEPPVAAATQSATAIIQFRPHCITESGTDSSPKGIAATASRAIGMTMRPTAGIAARLARRLRGASLWKWKAANGVVASPAINDVRKRPVANRHDFAATPLRPSASETLRPACAEIAS
jgi:hypothetical protein